MQPLPHNKKLLLRVGSMQARLTTKEEKIKRAA
jgi:hypothetical protein